VASPRRWLQAAAAAGSSRSLASAFPRSVGGESNPSVVGEEEKEEEKQERGSIATARSEAAEGSSVVVHELVRYL